MYVILLQCFINDAQIFVQVYILLKAQFIIVGAHYASPDTFINTSGYRTIIHYSLPNVMVCLI